MALREYVEAAARLHRLFVETHAGRRGRKLLRMTKDQFKRVIGRKQLEDSTFNEIAVLLAKQHQLVLGRSLDFVVLIPIGLCTTWPEPSAKAVARELRLKAPVRAQDNALSPAVAWPFP